MAVETLADSAIVIHLDFSKAQAEARAGAARVGNTAGRATADTFMDKFGKSFSSGRSRLAGSIAATAGLITAGLGVAGVVKFGLQTAASMEQAKIGFETMLGSGQKAQSFLTQLQKFAAATPFELPGLIEASRTLLGVGVSAKNVIPTLTAYGDAAGALGIKQDAFQRIMIAVSQSLSAGKIKLGDMNQLMNNGLPIWKLMSEAMGKPVPELQKMISKGQLLSKDVLPKLQKQMEKDYGGAMAKQSQTLAGVWSTLKDTVAIGLGNALQPLVPLLETAVPRAANVASAAFAGATRVVGAFAAGLNLRGDPRAAGLLGYLDTAGRGVRSFVEVMKGEGTTGSKGFVGAMEHLGSAVRAAVPEMKALGGEAVSLSGYLKRNADTVRDVVQVVTVAAASYLGYRSALYAVEVATKAVAAAQKAWAVIQTAIAFVQLASEVRSFAEAWVLLDVAMTANPIGLVVAGLVALGGALYLAWTHSATFRKIVEGAWAGVRVAVEATVNWIVKTAWPWIQRVWDGISSGAMSVYHGVVNAWRAVQGGVSSVLGWFTHTLWPSLQAIWRGVVADVTAFYHKFDPLWHVIARIVQAASAVIQLALAIIVAYIRVFVIPAFTQLWHNVIVPVANGIRAAINGMKDGVRAALSAVVSFVRGPVASGFLWLWHNIIQPAMSAIRSAVSAAAGGVRAVLSTVVGFLRNTLGPAFTWLYRNIVQPTFSAIRSATSSMWSAVRTPLNALASFVKGALPAAFRVGVGAIRGAWGALKTTAQAPVKFVVNSVINPLIGGFDKLARAFHTPTIDPIHLGFAEGGRIPGSPSSRDNRLAWLHNKAGQAIGNIKVATGEFIVNARDTAKALPLLQWINDGMKGGPNEVGRRLGRPVTDMPGDGSEGWAFARGGLVGFLSDIWGAISNPAKLIKNPLEGALKGIPGSGGITAVLKGMGHKLIDGFVHWATTFGGGTGASGNILAAQNFVRAQAGKPYVWASAGPGGYDCSGIVSAVYNVFKGRNPYSHTFSTESLPGRWFLQGPKAGPLVAGWSHPGQAPASASVGHMAGQIGGMPFESTGSRGVRVGFNTRKVTDFAQTGVARAGGGLVEMARHARSDFLSQITGADTGNLTLRPGWNMVRNGTGANEALSAGGDVHIHFHDSVITSRQAAEDLVVSAIQSAKKKRRIS